MLLLEFFLTPQYEIPSNCGSKVLRLAVCAVGIYLYTFPLEMDEPIHVAITRLSASSLAGGGLLTLHQLLQARASTLARTPNELKKSISSLSFEECSLGVCHLLALLWDCKGEGTDNFAFDATVNFLERCHQSQIQQCPAEFVAVVKSAVRFAVHADEQSATSESTGLPVQESFSLRLVGPLLESTEKFRPEPQNITSADSAFLQLCLSRRFYDKARCVLDRDAFKVTQLLCQSLEDCAAYYTAAGDIWIALEEYERAFNALDMALSLPSIPGETDSLQVEAFKRFALLSLMLRGRVTRPPPPSPNAEETLRMATYHKDFAQYELVFHQRNLASGARASPNDAASQNSLFSFLSDRLQNLERQVQLHAAQLKEDKTIHLALALLTSVVRRKVEELSRIFCALPLESFRKKMNVASDSEAVRLLRSLPSKPGTPPLCTYDEDRKLVLFNSGLSVGSNATEEEGTSVAFLGTLKREVESALQRVQTVSQHMRDAEAKVTDSEGFQRFVEDVSDGEGGRESHRDQQEGRGEADPRGRARERGADCDDGQSREACWQPMDDVQTFEEEVEMGSSSQRGEDAAGG
ncbi:putative COP9 signalosome complex subunit 3 [Toxoplasma gondii RUB]|uniref:COP9 signalosome complex subunit 3 n=3 Tax=Toxoplasma gondii TaxID=5811 RepID=B9Q7T1_TOXGV|nr:putative COP9 signalosome complex subunit 3 [Toxoplasma gondii VEG]KFG60825.1 putative COP9 signalosome complex subunit 3 [Toxoplasma gondii RUB]